MQDTIDLRSLEMDAFLIQEVPTVFHFRNEHCAFLRVERHSFLSKSLEYESYSLEKQFFRRRMNDNIVEVHLCFNPDPRVFVDPLWLLSKSSRLNRV